MGTSDAPAASKGRNHALPPKCIIRRPPNIDDPLPSEVPDDRGETKYFHGREEVLGDFMKILSRSMLQLGGTSFLIQGPPGGGKIALLGECRKQAEKNGWSTARIRPGALWDTMILKECLGIARQRLKNIGIGAKAEPFALEVGLDFDKHASTPLQTLMSRKPPLLLILDEAQRLGNPNLIPDGKFEEVTSLLEYIHNGYLKRPLVLLAGGLGNTLQAFHTLEISRFKNRCQAELEALRKEEEKAVITDWLVKEAGAKGDIASWIDAITCKTHRWPQHIMSYVDPAISQLENTSKKLTSEGLEFVMEQGEKLRRKYYEGRMVNFIAQERRSFARIVEGIPKEGSIEQDEIVKALAKEYGNKEAHRLFFLALQKGLFYYNNATEAYSVPIPSLRDWLVKSFPPKAISGPASRIDLGR